MVKVDFPIIRLKGTPFDCGYKYGTLARKQIRKNVEIYFEGWQQVIGSKRHEMLKRGKEFIPLIGEYEVDILEEIEGIARGAELSLEEIITLNARYELTPSGISTALSKGGCTSVAVLPQVAKNGHTIIGQNWDFRTAFNGLTVILEVEQKNKPNVVIMTEAGVVGHRGMNSAGIGLCFNALGCNWDITEPKTPFLVIARGILNADSLNKAILAVTRTSTAASGNFLLAQRDGFAIDLEVTPRHVGVLYDDDGILTHSNHFLDLTNREGLIDTIRRTNPDTLLRSHRAKQLLHNDRGQIGVDSFKRVFRDHFSYPQSLCRHADISEEQLLQSATISSIIIDLNDGALYVANGTPCNHEYYPLVPEILTADYK